MTNGVKLRATLTGLVLASCLLTTTAQAAPGCQAALDAVQGRLDAVQAVANRPVDKKAGRWHALTQAVDQARAACMGSTPTTEAPRVKPSSTTEKLFQQQAAPDSTAKRLSRERARSPKAGS